jgi:hypothetical protein
VTPEIWDAVWLARFAEQQQWQVMQEQSRWFVEACSTIWHEQALWRAELSKIPGK